MELHSIQGGNNDKELPKWLEGAISYGEWLSRHRLTPGTAPLMVSPLLRDALPTDDTLTEERERHLVCTLFKALVDIIDAIGRAADKESDLRQLAGIAAIYAASGLDALYESMPDLSQSEELDRTTLSAVSCVQMEANMILSFDKLPRIHHLGTALVRTTLVLRACLERLGADAYNQHLTAIATALRRTTA